MDRKIGEGRAADLAVFGGGKWQWWADEGLFAGP